MSKYRAGFTPEVVCVVNQLDKCDYEFASGSPDLLRQLERVLLDLRSWGETRELVRCSRGARLPDPGELLRVSSSTTTIGGIPPLQQEWSAMTRETASQMSRVIGSEIRRIRRRAGIQAVYVAEMAGWEPSKMSRIEHGYRVPVLDECPRPLGLIRATPGEFTELMSLFRTAPEGYYLWRHGPGKTEQLDCLRKLELEVDSLAMYDPTGVPELLLEESTVRAFLASGLAELDSLVKSRVQARLKQQRAFAENTLARATFFIDERCIHGFTGAAGIMQKQLRHLEFLAMTCRTHIRIIPLSAPMVARHGAVTLFESDSLPASVRLKTPLATLVLENDEDVSYYKHVLADIERYALSEGRSLTRLGELIKDSEVEI